MEEQVELASPHIANSEQVVPGSRVDVNHTVGIPPEKKTDNTSLQPSDISTKDVTALVDVRRELELEDDGNKTVESDNVIDAAKEKKITQLNRYIKEYLVYRIFGSEVSRKEELRNTIQQHSSLLREGLKTEVGLTRVLDNINQLAQEDGPLGEMAKSLLIEDAERLKDKLSMKDYDNLNKGSILESFEILAKSSKTTDEQTAYVGLILQNLDIEKDASDFAKMFETMIVLGGEVQKHEVSVLFRRYMKSASISRDAKVFTCHDMFGSEYFACQELVAQALDEEFKEIVPNFDDGILQDLFMGWMKTGKGESIARNIFKMGDLEKQFPGAAKRLYEEFNIKNFDRYPDSLLLRQLQEIDDVDKQYGAVIFPGADWNGVFDKQKESLEDLGEQLLAQNCALRISEVDTKLELVHILNRMRKKYGRMSFAILGGHGAPDRIELGGGDDNLVVTIDDVRREKAGIIANAFTKNATLILSSCSTGTEDGIGSEISKRLGIKVIGSEKEFGKAKYNVVINDGEIKFDVKYFVGENEIAGRKHDPLANY